MCRGMPARRPQNQRLPVLRRAAAHAASSVRKIMCLRSPGRSGPWLPAVRPCASVRRCRHERLLRDLADMQECQGQHLQRPDASALLVLKDEEGLLLRHCHFLRAGWHARARWHWPDLQWQAPSGWRGAPISRQSRRRRNSRHRAAGHRRPHWILPGRQRR